MIDWENTFILEVETDYNKRLFVESWFINSKSNVILVCIFAKLICEQLQLREVKDFSSQSFSSDTLQEKSSE